MKEPVRFLGFHTSGDSQLLSTEPVENDLVFQEVNPAYDMVETAFSGNQLQFKGSLGFIKLFIKTDGHEESFLCPRNKDICKFYVLTVHILALFSD